MNHKRLLWRRNQGLPCAPQISHSINW